MGVCQQGHHQFAESPGCDRSQNQFFTGSRGFTGGLAAAVSDGWIRLFRHDHQLLGSAGPVGGGRLAGFPGGPPADTSELRL